MDDVPNFTQLAITAREAFSKAIVMSQGEPRNGLVLQGEDFKITHISKPNNPPYYYL
jgi:hypothetical protein